MAQTVSAQQLHAAFRMYYDNQNIFVNPPVQADEVDLLLNYAQRSIQGQEFLAHKAADGKGFEMSIERKRNLQAFINSDPVEDTFQKVGDPKVPLRVKLPDNHRYTVSAEVCWYGLADVFFPVSPITHDEWLVAQKNAFKIPTYDEPALVMHNDLEELLPVVGKHRPHILRRWYLRLPLTIDFDKKVGMELPSWLEERVVQEAVTRAKFIAESAGANFQTALRELTK
jgi:hypothetical protein